MIVLKASPHGQAISSKKFCRYDYYWYITGILKPIFVIACLLYMATFVLAAPADDEKYEFDVEADDIPPPEENGDHFGDTSELFVVYISVLDA